jgi:hypothetical protein
MSGTHGQASVEWAGLLALAAAIGTALVLIAGPPLAHAVRDALSAALSKGTREADPPIVATAADIADVQSALSPPGRALTADAALLALARRRGSDRAGTVAGQILLATARERTPWLGRRRTYRPEARLGERFLLAAPGARDRDIETPTAAPTATWVTIARQREVLEHRLSHHTDKVEVGLNVASLVPGFEDVRMLGGAGGFAARSVARWLARGQKTAELAQAGRDVLGVLQASDGGLPGGMLVSDVIVSWPVHRTAWRGAVVDPHPLTDFGHGFGSHELPHDYRHVVYLRPIAGGLAVIGEDAQE